MKNSKMTSVMMLIIVPAVVFIICETISLAVTHTRMFSSVFTVYGMITSFAVNTLAAYAVNLNMSTGRMDLSLGAQQLVGVIIGGNIALKLNLGVAGVVVLAVLFAALSGLLTGIVFTTLRIDAFVLGLGLALVYEGASIAFNINGLKLVDSSITSVLSSRNFSIITVIIVIAIMYFIMNKTRFGSNYRAIQGNQKLATNSGISPVINCLICYAISGALMGLSGILNAGINGVMEPTVNMGSIGTIFGNGFLGVMVAYHLRDYTCLEVGIPIGVFCCKLISIVIGKLNLSTSYTTIVLMSSIFAIIIIMNFVQKMELDAEYRKRSLKE